MPKQPADPVRHAASAALAALADEASAMAHYVGDDGTPAHVVASAMVLAARVSKALRRLKRAAT